MQDEYFNACRRSSGLPELDELLGGGIDVRCGSSASVLIAGEPGCGKSTLGMQMACYSLKLSETVLIVTLEEKPSDADFLAKTYSLIPQGTQKIFDPNSSNFPVIESQSLRGDRPTICYSFFPDALKKATAGIDSPSDVVPLCNFLKDRLQHLKLLAQEGKVPNLSTILVDSLPSVTDRSGSALQRGLFKSLCEIASTNDSIIILAAEQQNDGDWRDFVADIVIHVGWGVDSVSGDVRFLRLLKTRGQDSWEGRHSFRILPTIGLRISPRTAEVLRREKSSCQELDGKLLRFSVDDSLNELLTDKDFRGNPANAGAGVFAGTSTLLYGEDETRKNLVAVRFLQAAASDLVAGTRRQSIECSGLLITCGTSVRSATELLRTFWLTSNIVGKHEDILVVDGPSFFESIDEFVSRIRQVIKTATRNITRAVVDDVGALVRNGYYSGPIRALLSAYGIASLFVHTIDASAEDKERELFDTVIRTRHLVLPTGQSRVAYRVVKMRGISPSRKRSMELRCPQPHQEIELKDSFAFYEELPDGTLTTIPWHLRLYFPSDDQGNYWAEEVRSLFSSVYAGSDAPNVQTFGRNDADSVFQAVIDLPDDYPLTATELINFDDYWSGPMAKRRRLVPLPEVFAHGSNEGVEELEQLFPTWVWKTAPRCPDRKQVVGVPHHLDFGIYTVRRDMLEDAGICLDSYVNDDTGLPQFTWSEMQQVSQIVGEKYRARPSRIDYQARVAAGLKESRDQQSWNTQESNARFLSFDTSANGIDESFLCFLLEVLTPYISNRTWDISGDFVFETAAVQQALFSLTKHLLELGWKPAFKPETDQSHEAAAGFPSAAALFQRHWFVSLWWQQRRDPNLRNNIMIMHPPVLESPLGSYPALSCRGHWYLGVVSGSGDFRRAAAAIKTLTSEVACGNLLRTEMGLPPLASLLSAATFFGHEMDTLRKVYFEQSFSRAEILRYHDIRTTCTIRFRDFLIQCCGGTISDDELLSRCKSLTQALDNDIESVVSRKQ